MRNGLVPLLLALGAGGLVAGGCRPAPGVPQNLILISIDTLRADHLGVYGYSRDTSPNLDRLARESTVFRQAVAQAPHTAPSHASLLTSLYYSVHQLSGEGDRLPAWRTTLAELLRDRGFATWAFVDGGKLRRAFGLDQGFDVYEDRTRGIEEILRDVERRLRTVNVPRFFLFIHCYDVHSPYTPPPPFDRQFEVEPYSGDFEPTSENLIRLAGRSEKLSPADLRHVIARYDGGIRYTDDQLGRLFVDLEERGLLDSSLVIVTSDHGEEFFEHGSWLHWQPYFTPNLHVPLFFRIPGWAPRVVDGPVELVDVLPTALELLALPPHPGAMGRSLVPRIDGSDSWHNGDPPAWADPKRPSEPQRTVISDRYQLQVKTETGETRLYDLVSDPDATTDISEREPEITRQLVASLEDRQRRIDDVLRASSRPATEEAGLDEETRRELEALGYFEPEPSRRP